MRAGRRPRQFSRTRERSIGSRSRLRSAWSRPTASRSRSASSAQGAHSVRCASTASVSSAEHAASAQAPSSDFSTVCEGGPGTGRGSRRRAARPERGFGAAPGIRLGAGSAAARDRRHPARRKRLPSRGAGHERAGAATLPSPVQVVARRPRCRYARGVARRRARARPAPWARSQRPSVSGRRGSFRRPECWRRRAVAGRAAGAGAPRPR